MQFTREIRTVLQALLLALMLITLSASYWAIVGPDTILEREDNARLFEDEANIQRGSIYDRNEIILVESVYLDDILTRTYLESAMYSTLGYFSLTYGVGGVESAFDIILRGDDLDENFTTYLEQDLLHIPQAGSDIQLTLDQIVQETIIQDLGNLTGAVIIQSVPDGEIIAMISQPTIDPNTLDSNWETLVTDEAQPFFNRVIQGNYQPGGIFYLPLIAGGISNDYDLNQTIENATQPVDTRQT